MKEPILRAVAMPPRLFWAPFAPAATNAFGVQLPMALFTQAFIDINPLWFVVTTVLVHIGLIMLGVREPHLSKMMASQGKFMKSYKSMYSHKGKYLAS